MTSLLKPGYALVLGSQEWTQQLLGLELKLEAAPLLNVLTVRLPVAAPMSAGMGDPVKLKLDGGEKETDVFSGSIDAIRRTYTEIRVTALDAGAKLAQYRPATTYEQITAATLARNLCGDVGVTTGDLEDGPQLAFYAADPSRTALEHLARVCAWAGALARVSAENRFESVVINGAQPDVAFKYGRDLLTLEQGKLSSRVQTFVVAGESGAGSTTDPSALRPSTDFFAGSRPNGPSTTHVWRFEPALRTAQTAGTAGAALLRLYDSGRQRGRMEAFLHPDLRPGTVFEIQELPDGMEQGPFWATSVTHQLSPVRARTVARFYQGGSSFDPLALLGSLVGSLF